MRGPGDLDSDSDLEAGLKARRGWRPRRLCIWAGHAMRCTPRALDGPSGCALRVRGPGGCAGLHPVPLSGRSRLVPATPRRAVRRPCPPSCTTPAPAPFLSPGPCPCPRLCPCSPHSPSPVLTPALTPTLAGHAVTICSSTQPRYHGVPPAPCDAVQLAHPPTPTHTHTHTHS